MSWRKPTAREEAAVIQFMSIGAAIILLVDGFVESRNLLSGAILFTSVGLSYAGALLRKLSPAIDDRTPKA